jgi:release factor glutamine methyltransferase
VTAVTAAGDTVGDVLADLVAIVGDAQESRRILAEVLGVGFASLPLELASSVSPGWRRRALDMGARRAAGVPLQHVLGTWGFRELDVVVDGRALVPRPETEQLVDVALAQLGSSGRGVAVDLGTGSGVIALSLAREGPDGLEVWATERSNEALELARVNLARLAETAPKAAARVRLCAGSWFEPVPAELCGAVELVVSNPPYVSEAEWEVLDAVVRDHDPKVALVPGPTGLEALAEVVDESLEWLAPGGALVVELAPRQADAVRARAERRGYDGTRIGSDLAGRPRFLVARRPAG